MSPTKAEVPAPVPVARVPAQVQRCGGMTCPAGTCDHDEEVQRLADGPGPGAVPASVLGVLGTSGTPLDAPTRTSMEGRFGHDFGRVRIHTDADAARSAVDIHALAYTFGPHVVMGAGRYQPHSAEGQRLLAHELTHVVQQGEQSGTPTSVSDPHDPAEVEAERRAAVGTAASEPGAAGGLRRVCVDDSSVVRREPDPAAGVPPSQETDSGGISPGDLGEAGLIALANFVKGAGADEAALLRGIYNKGAERIAQEEVRLIAEVTAGRTTNEVVARQLSAMRHQLAEEVRRTGSVTNRVFAELFDKVRGNAGRPTYDTLRQLGKSDLEIIRSASKTNEFVNRLPARMRWTGAAFKVAAFGISVYVILDAPPSQRGEVAQKEVEGILGAEAGSAAGEGICIAFGMATEGLGLLVCGLLGGLLGSTAAQKVGLLEFMDIAPHRQPGQAGTAYMIVGDWDYTDLFIIGWANRTVSRSERVVVVSTGRVSGSQMSGRFGHYRSEEVLPANDAAVALFGTVEPRWVPQPLLALPQAGDLQAPEDARDPDRVFGPPAPVAP